MHQSMMQHSMFSHSEWWCCTLSPRSGPSPLPRISQLQVCTNSWMRLSTGECLNMIDSPLLKTLSMQSLNDTAELRPSAGDLAGALGTQMRLQQLEDNTSQNNQEILSLQPHLSQERHESTFRSATSIASLEFFWGVEEDTISHRSFDAWDWAVPFCKSGRVDKNGSGKKLNSKIIIPCIYK